MKKFLLLCTIGLASVAMSQNINIADKPSIVIKLVKNDAGEILLKISGHSQPVELCLGDEKIAILYEQDTAVNLSQCGFESKILSLSTESGSAGSKIDAQPIVPPVTPAVFSNPSAATPF